VVGSDGKFLIVPFAGKEQDAFKISRRWSFEISIFAATKRYNIDAEFILLQDFPYLLPLKPVQ
jgi:hypothetical protein